MRDEFEFDVEEDETCEGVGLTFEELRKAQERGFSEDQARRDKLIAQRGAE